MSVWNGVFLFFWVWEFFCFGFLLELVTALSVCHSKTVKNRLIRISLNSFKSWIFMNVFVLDWVYSIRLRLRSKEIWQIWHRKMWFLFFLSSFPIWMVVIWQLNALCKFTAFSPHIFNVHLAVYCFNPTYFLLH